MIRAARRCLLEHPLVGPDKVPRRLAKDGAPAILHGAPEVFVAPCPAPRRIVRRADHVLPSDGFQVLNEQLKQIAYVEPEVMNGSSHIPIVRATLREILLQGLDDIVYFEKELAYYEQARKGDSNGRFHGRKLSFR